MKIIEYCEDFGAISFPEGFEALLEGRTIEEQLSYFRVANGLYLKKPFSERRKNYYDAAYKLEEVSEVDAVVVDNDKIVGIRVWDSKLSRKIICRPENGYCCYYEEELDGSGYKTCSFNCYLICVSDDFEKDE